jgi:CubicO group peptidase (beta-lactamase class C family)
MNINNSLFLVLLLCVSCTNYRIVSRIRPDPPLKHSTIDVRIRKIIHEKKIDVLGIAVIRNNEPIETYYFNADETEKFQAASISKVLSAYAAIILVESGKIGLDVPLYTYLPERFIPEKAGDKITLRMVLSHTSGLGNDIGHADRKVYWEPGKEFHYSGMGFQYLMKVIENITKMSFDEFMNKTILKPLSMNNSTFSITNSNGTKFISAAASLETTPIDIVKFMIEMNNPRLLDVASVEMMQTDYVIINKNYSWGLGVGIQHDTNGKAIWHWGNNADYHKNLMFMYPNRKIGIIIMIKGVDGNAVYTRIAETIIGGSYLGMERALSK